MIVLALDTALAACQAGVFADGRPLAVRSEAMARGHQERIGPMCAEVMSEAGLEFSRIDRIAVTVGPGSFTGLRVGLAFAKGLAVALDRPCVGVGCLEALAEPVPGFVAAAIDARRERVYLQLFADGSPVCAPDIVDLDVAPARLAEAYGGGVATLVGPGSALIAGVIRDAGLRADEAPELVAVARIAAARPDPVPMARPLYLRGADARTLAERGLSRP